ncbi:transaldolase [Streptomyces sp. NBC_01304]|uniref:transaldolase n=1 Tax=Streptomyces sp. NBC_01304 TaxID=2903818 RepID=UPI002E0E99D0|nr:transaldolase [Streptomyces sp. NBC_01304]
MHDILDRLTGEGVSLWLDDLSRTRITGGSLADVIRDKYVTGVTTNPAIFSKAIAGGAGYQAQLRDLAARGLTVDEAVRMITTKDVRDACDVLRWVYDATGGRDGRVSVEVDPRFAHHAEATVAEARQLHWLVDRENVMIKIPATEAGLPAITETVADGISVNATLIFSLERHQAVMDAYLAGLERARDAGHDLSKIHSVASFFVSRVDTEIDRRLDDIGTPEARALRGRAALANARLAYEAYEKVFRGERWAALEAEGAHRQRVLWASTGVKDPAYPDTLYVDQLVAPDTVNTMPEATLDATADHAQVTGDTIRPYFRQAGEDLEALAVLGVSYDEVVALLEKQAVTGFEEAWRTLLDALADQLQRSGV